MATKSAKKSKASSKAPAKPSSSKPIKKASTTSTDKQSKSVTSATAKANVPPPNQRQLKQVSKSQLIVKLLSANKRKGTKMAS